MYIQKLFVQIPYNQYKPKCILETLGKIIYNAQYDKRCHSSPSGRKLTRLPLVVEIKLPLKTEFHAIY